MGVEEIAHVLSAHQTIALDSCILVYYLENHEVFGEAAQTVVSRVVERGNVALLSTLALLEVQVGPYRKGALDVAAEYFDVLGNLPNLFWIPVTYAIADAAARLRGKYRLGTPDSIHLATAAESGATLFVTNDRRLPDLHALKYLVIEGKP